MSYDAGHMLPWLPRLAVLGVVLLATGSPAADETAVRDDLARARLLLVDSAREYRATLARLLGLQEGLAARADRAAAQRRALYEQAIVSRRELEECEQSAARVSAQVDETRRRLAEADSVLGETLAALEWARANPTAAAAVTAPAVIGSQSGLELAATAIDDLDRFFLARFARSLPVSARGQTAVHDRLGLDHRRAFDVAVHPDSPEGRVLIEYLRRQHIPFLAFRGVIPGASTGAHIHVGRASVRLGPGGDGLR